MSFDGAFAAHYDAFGSDTDFEGYCSYLERIFLHFKVSPSSIADLGCGTGSIALALSKREYGVTGVDLSCDMLSIADKKAKAAEVDLKLICQDFTQLNLNSCFDAVISCHDSINYLTDKNSIKKLFRGVFFHLKKGGVFVFDLNTEYKYKKILDGNTFTYDSEGAYCIWRNAYDEKSLKCMFELTVFEKDFNGLFKRHDSCSYQRFYGADEIIKMLSDEGFKKAAVFGDRSLRSPRENSERMFFVAVK